MKKLIFILAVFFTPLLWRGAGAEVFAQIRLHHLANRYGQGK